MSAPDKLAIELHALALRWDAALSQHHAAELDRIYGAHVRLYGSLTEHNVALRLKAAALTSDYTQSIGAITLDQSDPAHPRALFDKTWKVHGKTQSIRGSLGFTNEDGRWVVTEESDVKADSSLLDEHGHDSCLGLVHAAVLSTEDGATYRHPPYGTLYVCGPPECPTFQIAGVSMEKTAMERLASFDVDPKTGVVSHIDPIAADPAIVARMKAACAKWDGGAE